MDKYAKSCDEPVTGDVEREEHVGEQNDVISQDGSDKVGIPISNIFIMTLTMIPLLSNK